MMDGCVKYFWLVHFICIATEYHLGLLKAKLAKYRAQLLEAPKSSGAKVCSSILCIKMYHKCLN